MWLFVNNQPCFGYIKLTSRTNVILESLKSLRGCLHDTEATFAPERVHSGSLSWLYICLHDTTTNFMLARVTPA